ncbi:MAG TPA: hypothetical protein VGG84_10075 [Gemmatimonadaceae bacterium]|jgi:hypothetical protein
MRRLGCLLLLIVLAAIAWAYRSHWLTVLPGRSSGTTTTSSDEPLWQPLSPAAAARGKRAIDALNSPKGPVYANLRASEIASYAFQSSGNVFPASADSVEAAVIGDVLYLRAIVPTKAIAGSGALGPLAGLLNERERLSIGGSFHVVRPGLSEFQLRDIKLRQFSVPPAAIPRIVQQITHGKHTDGVADDALPVPTPPSLADVRIGNNRVTLYKTTPGQ